MDWNWYFSTLSQSAAAIVGIFGAFVITKILNNQTVYEQKVSHSKRVLIDCKRVSDSARALSVNWYIERIASKELEDIRLLVRNGEMYSIENYYDQADFSIYMTREVAFGAISKVVETENKRKVEEEERARTRSQDPFNYLGRGGISPSLYMPPSAQSIAADNRLEASIESEREAIDRVRRDAVHQIRLVEDVLDSVEGDPESSVQITFVLILLSVLFFVGVIYPISFLPSPSEKVFDVSFGAVLPVLMSGRGLLLLITSLVFCVILAIFYWTNRSLMYPADIKNQLNDYLKIESYSHFFLSAQKNERAGAAATES